MKNVNLFFISLFISIFSTLGFAGTIHVPTDYLTIQVAIDASNSGDTIIVADGVYTEDGNIITLLEGKDIVIKSENGPENCILDGAGKIGAKCFMVLPDSANKKIVTIDGFTIQNFHTGISGGGSLYIKNNIIKNCYYEGIHCDEGNHNIINNVLINNSISQHTEISEIKYNRYNDPIQCYYKGYAYSGVAIAIFNSVVKIQNNLICDNFGSLAGGIYCNNYSTGEILNNTILNNKTYSGGGITINNPSISVMNNIITNSYNNSAANRLERWLQKNLFWQINYDGAKRSSVNYYLGFKNNGEAGDARIYGPGLDTTFTVQTGEYYWMETTSFVETNGFYGGLDLTIQLGSDTLSFVNIFDIEPFGSLYGGCLLLSNSTIQSFGTNNKDVFGTSGAGIFAVSDETFQNIMYNDFYNNMGGNYILRQSSNDTILNETNLPDTDGNISEDPKLLNTFSLMDGSLCIDAGNPDVIFNDAFLPPGKGTVRNDMGISGGPYGIGFTNNATPVINHDLISDIQTYPNPSIGYFNISFHELMDKDYCIEIFNNLGSIIQSTEKQKGTQSAQIDLSGYPIGMYIIRIRTGNKFYQSKIIKR
jgi:hypothetical protein